MKRTGGAAPTGHYQINLNSFSFQSRRRAHIKCSTKMKILNSIILIVMSATVIASGDEALRGVCLDGNTERAFGVSAAIPQQALDGGYLPRVDHAEDGKTPKSITWAAASGARPVLTLIGRFKDHEIVDLTFPVAGAPQDRSGQPFEAKVLAFRVGTAVSSPLLPFFVIMGDEARWYEQVFAWDKTDGFRLEVSRTVPGNGVMWANFTFGFHEGGALIKQVSSGGRGQQTTVTKFRKDGSIDSTEKLDEN